MIDLLKKSAACAFAIISAVFTFVPEAIFGKVILISEDVLKQFTLEGYTSEINIIVNRVLTFVIVWFIAAFGYKAYLLRLKAGEILKAVPLYVILDQSDCF